MEENQTGHCCPLELDLRIVNEHHLSFSTIPTIHVFLDFNHKLQINYFLLIQSCSIFRLKPLKTELSPIVFQSICDSESDASNLLNLIDTLNNQPFCCNLNLELIKNLSLLESLDLINRETISDYMAKTTSDQWTIFNFCCVT